MPDSGKAEEGTIRTNSVGIVGTSDQSLAFASCPTCPGPNRTPTLHADQCMPVDSTQGDKASSSSTPAENQHKDGRHSFQPHSTWCQVDSKLRCHQLFPDELEALEGNDRSSVCWYPLCKLKFNGFTLAESATEPESLNPGSAGLKGKRKAAATEDGPESKTNRKATIEDYNDCKESLEKCEQRMFQDLPGSSSKVGPCMPILAERWDAPELTDNLLMDHIVPQRAPLYAPPFATAQTPGFSFDISSQIGGIISFMDERLIYDPDRVGLERLNILSRADGGEPNFMDR